jgi:hypothetical protein
MNTKYSVHEAMSQIDIALVMDHREKIGRKFDAPEIGHTFEDIAKRFVRGYRGDFPYMLDMQGRLQQYGKLFASQSAGVLNCMVAQVTRELQQAVRQEKHKQSTGKRTTISFDFSALNPEKAHKETAVRGPRPVRGELFSNEDMEGTQ